MAYIVCHFIFYKNINMNTPKENWEKWKCTGSMTKQDISIFLSRFHGILKKDRI